MKRLDQALVDRGLVPSRSRAQDAIRRGLVRVSGKPVLKAGAGVDESDALDVLPEAGLAYVSRGALKLKAALDAFRFPCQGRVALDAGASTGGFTEVLLERGARMVYAVDVGRGQLHARLRCRPDVLVMEEQDVRALTAAHLSDPVTALVADLSFISLTKTLPHLMGLVAPGSWLAALVKPQFEVGRDGIGKGGLVKDDALRESAVATVRDLIAAQPGWTVRGVIPSPVEGGSGNVEFLIGAERE